MVLRDPPEERSADDLLSFGVVNLDKPPGPSSHQVSAWMRDLADVDRAAHAGTLDPTVTGCLPVLLGDATRLAGALLGRKEYVVVLELHAEAPTDLERVFESFTGGIYQKPPRKSAVRRDRRVREIFSIGVLDRSRRRVLLRVACESGTYIRKLCHDLGLALGTGANMGDLRRTETEPFDDSTLVTMHDFVDALASRRDGDDLLREVVSPGERAIEHLPSVTIAESAAEEVAHGAPVYAPGVIHADERVDEGVVVACHTPADVAVCLGTMVGDPSAEAGLVVDVSRVLV